MGLFPSERAAAVDHQGGAGGEAELRCAGDDRGEAMSSRGCDALRAGVVARGLRVEIRRRGPERSWCRPRRGATASTRTSGASTRASDFVITSMAGFGRAHKRSTSRCRWCRRSTTPRRSRPSPDAFSRGAKVRMVANWPRQFTANIRSISSSSSASRSAWGTRLGEAGGIHQHVQLAAAPLDLAAQRRPASRSARHRRQGPHDPLRQRDGL